MKESKLKCPICYGELKQQVRIINTTDEKNNRIHKVIQRKGKYKCNSCHKFIKIK